MGQRTRGSVALMDGLNVRDGASLSTQVHIGRKTNQGMLSADKFKAIERNERPWWKPRDGGLWTAQWDETYGGGWVQWCLSEEFEADRSDPTWEHVYLLEPDPLARVLVIDSYEDLERVYAQWPHANEDSTWREGYPAWDEIANTSTRSTSPRKASGERG